MAGGGRVSEDENENVREHEHENENELGPPTLRGRMLNAAWRLGGPWAAVTGVIATTSVCPYCGSPQCAVGIGQAAGIGAVTSGVLWAVNRLRGKK